MTARLVQSLPAGADWSDEVKLDGFRALIPAESGGCSLRTVTAGRRADHPQARLKADRA
jgi:ATP-dependent DNA ligase